MRGFLTYYEEEGFAGIALIQPVERGICNKIRNITVYTGGIFWSDELWTIILTLAIQYPEIIETLWQASQVPFANPGRLVTAFLKNTGKYGLGGIKYFFIEFVTIHVTVFSRKQGGATRSANRICDKGIRKQGPFPRDPVNIGCLY